MAVDLRPVGLRTEYLVDPLGIDTTVPRLFWTLESDTRGQRQTAYQVVVASSLERLEAPDLWDSGKVESRETTHIEYAGAALGARQSCWWRVRSWDRDGEAGRWSETAFFETGLLSEADWEADWISLPPTDAAADPPPVAISEKFKLPPAAQLRYVYNIDQPVKRARIYATALGVYELSVGGQRVGDAYFAPGYTDYSLRVNYQTYDVTGLLTPGDGVFAAELADGWYCGYVGYGDHRDNFGPYPQLRAQLVVDFEDGTTETFGTDAAWVGTLDGPRRVADLQHGEVYDTRRETPGWDTAADFDASDWRSVTVEPDFAGKITASPEPPIRVTQELPTVAITEPTPGVYVFDLGQNMVGWVRLTVPAGTPAGTIVTMRFAEILQPDGTIYTINLRSARQTDDYVVKGDGSAEVWEPHYSFHGFRYVEVTGLTAPLPETIVGRVAHNEMAKVGQMETSSALVNQLLANIDWGQRGNFVSVPTDCPQRDERLGWTGDAQVFIRTATYNRDVSAFFTKWLRDLVDGQSAEGAFPDVAPRHRCIVGSGASQEFAGEGTAAWGDAGTICPWTFYEVYGDKRLLAECYPAMKRWVAYLEAHSDGLLRPAEGYGDWLSIEADTPRDVLATAYFARSVDLTAKAAAVLGKYEDVAALQDLSTRVKSAFNTAYVSADGDIKGSTQSDYLMALKFDLVSPELLPKVAQRLADDLRARGNHLSTGFVGVGYLCPMLTKFGYNDLAYDLLNQTTFPSWGYSIAHGATTIWERWDGWTHDKGFQDPGMNSFNHYSLGSVGEWLYETVAGIDLSTDPGFKLALIRPRPGGGLTHCRAGLDTLHGRYETEWRLEDGTFTLDVTIPANCSAVVHLETGDGGAVTEGGAPADDVAGIRRLRYAEGAAVFIVGSGTYRFRAPILA